MLLFSVAYVNIFMLLSDCVLFMIHCIVCAKPFAQLTPGAPFCSLYCREVQNFLAMHSEMGKIHLAPSAPADGSGSMRSPDGPAPGPVGGSLPPNKTHTEEAWGGPWE